MTTPDEHESATTPPGESRDPATEPPPVTPKPVGDAFPVPREPGFDEPLPPKKRPDAQVCDLQSHCTPAA